MERSLKETLKKQHYENVKLMLFHKVKTVFYEIYYVSRNITLMEKNIQLLSYLESVVETKYRSGTATFSDLLKIKIELDKLRDQLRSVRAFLSPLKARLNAILNRPLNAPITIPNKILADTTQFKFLQIQKWQKENNPELKSIEYLKDKEKIYKEVF